MEPAHGVEPAGLPRRAALGALATGTAAVAGALGAPSDAGATSSATGTDRSMVFDPRDFGAVFDGVTDDTAAILAANDAARAVAGTLRIPPGTGIVSSTIPLHTGVTYQGQSRSTSVVKAAPGVAIDVVMAAAGYLTGATTSGGPLRMSRFTVDGNKASGATCSGVILMNYRAFMHDVTVQNVSADGIVLTDKNSAGTVLTNTAVENHIESCWILNPGNIGIWVVDTALSGVVTDGYIDNCVFQGAGVWAMRIERAAGWFISHNHAYGNRNNGIYLDQLWCTYFHHNEVDHFGVDGGAATFVAFQVQNIISGRPSTFDHNHAAANETAGSTYRYYSFRAPNVSVQLNLSANTAHVDSGAAASSTAFLFTSTPGGTMTVRGGPSNLVDGPPVPCTTSGNVVFADGRPGQAWVTAGSTGPGTDPLGLGVATTIDAALVTGTANVVTAGTAVFGAFIGSGQTVSALVLHVGASAGTIEVAVYSSTGTGRSRVPGTKKATTGVIPCPAAGTATVALTSPVTIAPGDFAAVWADGTAFRFGRTAPVAGAVAKGRAYYHSGLPTGLPTTLLAGANGSNLVPWVSTP